MADAQGLDNVPVPIQIIDVPGPPNYNHYLPLYDAALNGDWDSALKFIEANEGAQNPIINDIQRTALHVAAGAGQSEFVIELVKTMDSEVLEQIDSANGDTALHFASLNASLDAVRAIRKKNKLSTQIRNTKGWTPLLLCAAYVTKDRKDILEYLCIKTKKDLESDMLPPNDHEAPIFSEYLGAELVCNVTAAGFYDVAFYLVKNYRNLATAQDGDGCTMLDVLAKKNSDFPSGTKLGFWKRRIYSLPGIKQVYLKKLVHVQALELLKCVCLEISSMPTKEDILVFLGSAVTHRKGKIFGIMYGTSPKKRLMACWRVESGNNILHLAARLPRPEVLSVVAGAALQMQRELQWFKEVEEIVQPTYKESENEENETPKDVFAREHQGLAEKGEKWLKDTASSCMVVGTLIITVVFAAAFTVPGGNYQDSDIIRKGTPIFLYEKPFTVFVVADVLAFFSSVMSVLMFLSILTSRYAMEDFLELLPKRLIVGLATLFFSIAAMMVAFSATLCMVLNQRLSWAFVPIGVIATFPVYLYVFLQFPLLIDMIHSTYWPDLFHGDSELA
ncbi:protein ACCELERATED CELL DEATH 6-like [Papaver somniferum]|uniref:protein ACCELERATED CELL DEATH 6-like n=1 Tax=Papaver somniferum TaxID=3469 RepID=UPI000E705A24|nr:protein ACCELERATED CELL DEATH 6-like [Papaver somniferum]